MYDQIFNDFNTIKRHYERNGKKEFEESAVLELLENLYPLHGSVQTVQMIIDMLDAQRIRDTKSTLDDIKAELSNSSKSSADNENDNGKDKDNDNDNDIIEIEIPKKVHPLIDLTENSTELDEAIIIEKFENKSIIEHVEINSDSNIENNDSEASCHEIYSLSDSDVSKHFNEDSSLMCDDITRSNNDQQLLNLLAILDQPNQVNLLGGEHSNNDSSLDISEILEENNNDPNNNFDEENVDVNHTVNNNSNILIISHDTEPRKSEEVLDDFFNSFLDPVPNPRPNKEATSNSEVNDSNKPALNYNFFNPAPGCSKDMDISQNIEPFKANDNSLEEDIICIQEIIPWAASDKIRSLLLKYSSCADRKQSTLLKLMKGESKRMKSHTVKRKLDNDTFGIESKIAKTNSNFEMEGSLDTASNLHLDSIIFNNSSNSESPKCLAHVQSTFKTNQNLQTFINNEFSKTTLENKWSHFDNNPCPILNPVDSNIPVFCNSSLNVPITNCSIKKERNETVVSGLLQEQEHLETLLNGKNHNDKSVPSIPIDLFDQSRNEPFFLNGKFQLPPIKNLLSHQDDTIEKISRQKTDNIFGDIRINAFANNTKSMLNTNRIVLQPPKLLLKNPVNPEITTIPSKVNLMRPAILKFNNQQNNLKNVMLEPKDKVKGDLNGYERLHTNHASMLNGSILSGVHIIQRQLPVPNRIQCAPSATIVRENQADKNVSNIIKNSMANDVQREKYQFIRIHRPLNMCNRPEKPEVVVEPVIQNQLRSTHNDPVVQPGTSGLNSNAVSISISTGTFDQSIYNKLRSIFPDVKASYIKKICINPPNVPNTSDKAYVLNVLIEHLLTEGSDHLRPVEYVIDQPTVASVSIDDKYNYLLEIFPDADPTYIRDFVFENPSEQKFEEFIQRKMESRDYPTKEQYMSRIKITEQIKQYTTDLNIEKFLELFPDPFKQFEDASRKCTHQAIAMEFLKSLFVKNKICTISHQYKSNNHNLSLTAKALTAMGPDMKSKRVSNEMPTEDIPLLQEMAFIKNKQKIINHLNMLRSKEDQLFKELKEQNLLLTCQCCYNDECMPTKSSECNEGHVFCHECIVRGTESALADAEAHVRCFTDCTSEFSLATLQKVLPPTKFSALLQKRQTAEVIAAGMDGLVSCPFCHFASIPAPEDKVFKCLNPECMKETCKFCKELNHVPLKCDEVIKTDKARHILEEKMTEALVRTCYQCKKQFYKEDGCNKMKCTCGALMCYLCSKPIKGYDHFNAQGGANTHLCPLWSDDRLLNATAVRKVAKDVKEMLLRNNPNLKIDADALLPKIPAKTRGPHDDIPNANQLPEHILRIANAAQR